MAKPRNMPTITNCAVTNLALEEAIPIFTEAAAVLRAEQEPHNSKSRPCWRARVSPPPTGFSGKAHFGEGMLIVTAKWKVDYPPSHPEHRELKSAYTAVCGVSLTKTDKFGKPVSREVQLQQATRALVKHGRGYVISGRQFVARAKYLCDCLHDQRTSWSSLKPTWDMGEVEFGEQIKQKQERVKL